METRRERIQKPELGMIVYHENLYEGKELMKIVGIREHEIELEGDYSGGTHNVQQKSWMPIIGIFRLRKVCDQISKTGTCHLHNVHCSYPDCEPYL